MLMLSVMFQLDFPIQCFKVQVNTVRLPSFGACRTVMILSFRTDSSGQTVQTQIRLLLDEQSDQGFHCLVFHLHVIDKIHSGLASLFEF